MSTANDLIRAAAIKLGAIQSDESLSSSDATDSLQILNSMLDFWAIDKMFVYQIVQSTYTWPSATASRTIGPTGDFVATRPEKIEDGSFSRINNVDYPFIILRRRDSYDAIHAKTIQSSFPDMMYYEPSYPNGTMYIYPLVSANTEIHINTWQALQSFATLTTALALPPGYQWAIENSLAEQLQPIFNVPIPPQVTQAAREARAKIKQVNHIPITSATETVYAIRQGRRSNILAGE